jgi:3-deoxy-D-manno-octulosonic-acid transferase
MTPFPSPRLRRTLWLYKAAWVLLFPAILAYLAWRGRKDSDYTAHLGERFGIHVPMRGAVWVHAVSLGELRSAVPLIRALLARGERVVTSHFTPAGRRESLRIFAAEIAAGQLRPVWVPFEFHGCYKRFFRAFAPKFGLVMEIEVWPQMILSARRAGVPLYLCNAQYPAKSFAKDQGRARADLMAGFAGGLVKSDLQRQRFAAAGLSPIAVTGELRFDQPIPTAQTAPGQALHDRLAASGRQAITIASAIEGEDALYIDVIRQTQAAWRGQGLPAPLFVYVPRAPERFDAVAGLLTEAGLKLLRRSQHIGADLSVPDDVSDVDVILGDSLGEMYFYLSICDQAIVGGGYMPKGAHNISEPLSLGKPVIVGPYTWTIEYPAVEACAAGVCDIVPPEGLAAALAPGAPRPDPVAIAAFFSDHSGAVGRTLAALDGFLAGSPPAPKS